MTAITLLPPDEDAVYLAAARALVRECAAQGLDPQRLTDVLVLHRPDLAFMAATGLLTQPDRPGPPCMTDLED